MVRQSVRVRGLVDGRLGLEKGKSLGFGLGFSKVWAKVLEG